MNIVVCIKSVPETAEADLEVGDSGDEIETDDLVFGVNEWDNYAVEAAIQLKEAQGGTITAVTLGDDEAEDVLRRAMAMGADEAIHINDDSFEGSDAATVARALGRAIKDMDDSPDLVLTGVQSSDAGNGQTGVLLAQELGLAHATLAVGLELAGDGDGGAAKLNVTRELEANTLEKVELPLPAVVTVQSGINQPRYVSIMGIRKVRKKTIDEKEIDDLDFEEEEVGADAAVYSERSLALPETASAAEMLEGNLPEICGRTAQIIREKGGLS